MKIEGNRNLNFASKEKVQSDLKEKIENKTDVREKSDVYEFNTSSTELTVFFGMAKEVDEVRYEKIKELQEREARGEYHVSGKDVVLKVLGEKLRDGNH